jgi:hypothetical protein
MLKWRLFRRLVHREPSICGRLDTSLHHQSNPAGRPLVGVHLFRAPLARTLRLEIGSFLSRIRMVLDTQMYRRGVVWDPACRIALNPEECQRAQDASNQDMRNLSSARPWLTLVDAEIFVQGWQRGAEWHARSVDSGLPSSKPHSFQHLNPEAATPESSRCDPSARPPSQE